MTHALTQMNLKCIMLSKKARLTPCHVHTLTGVAGGWCRPIQQMVAPSIPSQGTRWGCRFGPQSGSVQETTHPCYSPSASPSISLSLKINKKNIFFKRSQTQKSTDCMIQFICHSEKAKLQGPKRARRFPGTRVGKGLTPQGHRRVFGVLLLDHGCGHIFVKTAKLHTL